MVGRVGLSFFAREGLLLEEFCINGRYVDDVIMAKYLSM